MGTDPPHASDVFQAAIQDQVDEFDVTIQFQDSARFEQQVTYLENMCRSYGDPVKVINAP